MGVCMLVRRGMGVWGELEKHRDLTNSILKVFDNFDHDFVSWNPCLSYGGLVILKKLLLLKILTGQCLDFLKK